MERLVDIAKLYDDSKGFTSYDPNVYYRLSWLLGGGNWKIERPIEKKEEPVPDDYFLEWLDARIKDNRNQMVYSTVAKEMRRELYVQLKEIRAHYLRLSNETTFVLSCSVAQQKQLGRLLTMKAESLAEIDKGTRKAALHKKYIQRYDAEIKDLLAGKETDDETID
jgi:hypothetical protein